VLIEDAVEDREAGLLIRALALGDRAEMADEIQESFNKSGLAHILSVSGLHIAVVAAGLFWALRWLLSRSERLLLRADVRALASLCSIPATWLYVLATGAEVPAVRSGIMASAFFLAMAIGRDRDGPSALGAALLAVLALDPSALRSISFQLSFTAVAGLILLTRPLRKLLPVARPTSRGRGFGASLLRTREALLETVAGSLAASLATAPLVAMAFQRASLVAVLSNAVAMPVATGLTALAATSAFALPFSDSASALLVLVAAPFARALLWLSELFASLPASSTRVAAPGLPVLLLWYVGLLGLVQLKARRQFARRLLIASSALLLLIAAASWTAPRLRRELKVTFLAVGQGDCALIQLPGGENVLVDAGGDPAGHFDVGKRVVLPALIELGATRLHAVVLSHPHPDHGLGLVSVLQELRADELWLPSTATEGDLLETLLKTAGERGMKVRRLGTGDVIERGSVRFEVLHPLPTSTFEGNDGSLVLRLVFGEVSFLLPGDVEEQAENVLTSARLAPVTVLKVPHHGSRTSSGEPFIRQLAPRHAVISSGRNRFGFPHASVVERLLGSGCRLYQTARDGAVTFSTDGSRLTVERFRESRLPLATRVSNLLGGVRSQELP
jgi:competence protein ComEC